MLMRGFCRRSIFLSMVGFAIFFAQTARAARLLEVYIEKDSNVVAHTYYDDGGRADPSTVWRYLRDPPIMVDDDVTALEGNVENPLEAVLEGKLLVRFQHVDRVIAQASLYTLTLTREDDRAQAWFLPASEVERTAAVAGLGPSTERSQGGMLSIGLSAILVPFLFLSVGGAAAIAFYLSRSRTKKRET